jgi:hypothetical protein
MKHHIRVIRRREKIGTIAEFLIVLLLAAIGSALIAIFAQ